MVQADCTALQGPTATLGIYVDAGSVYEKPMQSGETFQQYLLHQSTS